MLAETGKIGGPMPQPPPPERRLPVLDPTRDPAATLYEHVPSGWYDLARSSELPPGAVITRRLAGKDVVLYRTAGGQACATDPYCPHMGAHLGCGGRVKGESLVCPFHAFEFATDGKCVATGYGTPPPPRARLGTMETFEIHGCVFVWYGAAGEPASFRIPEVDEDGWMPMLDRTYEMRGHPQETNENSVDVGHFGIVHGYENVRVTKELHFDGGALHVSYAMDRVWIPGMRWLGVASAEFDINVHGFGYSRVEVVVPKLGMRSRHFVFATPIAPERLRLRVGFAVKRESMKLPLGGRLVRRVADRVLNEAGIVLFAHDVGQDFEIWSHKRYVHPPQLAEGDGPIGRYRRWARRFYPNVVAAEDQAAAE
jgi:nitrite reductase/ring-hydroxylating ferredoxin subunit